MALLYGTTVAALLAAAAAQSCVVSVPGAQYDLSVLSGAPFEIQDYRNNQDDPYDYYVSFCSDYSM